MVKIVDGRVTHENVLVSEITQENLTLLFQSGYLTQIGSVAANVAFPVSYGQIPTVVASPAGNWPNTYARVLGITPDSFQWVADAPGSADWLAFGVK